MQLETTEEVRALVEASRTEKPEVRSNGTAREYIEDLRKLKAYCELVLNAYDAAERSGWVVVR